MTDKRDDNLDDRITASARRLSAGVAPERDLWVGIEQAISKPRQSRWSGPFAQAAMVLLLIGGSSGVTYLALNDRSEIPQEVISGPALNVVPASFGADHKLGTEYENARAGLEERLEQELKKMPAGTQANIRKNLQAVKTAIAQINKALAEEPDSIMLQKLLLSTYQRELQLMAQVDGFVYRVLPRHDI